MRTSLTMPVPFISLPQSVLSKIFAQLFYDDYAAFHSLRAVCSASRSLSEEFLFREVTLTGAHDVERTFLQRMRTSDEAVGRKVQCVRVKPPRQNPASCAELVRLLVDCWNHLIHLKKIIWEAPYPFPPSLQSLLTDRPTLRLIYINNDRGPYTMDKAVLSSSHLHHLDFTALANQPQAVCFSEMCELKRCLLQARNLRILRLHVGVASRAPNDDFQESPLNLPFRDGDMFPALEELTLDPMLQNYFPTAEHCEIWSCCMDWGQLHTLDFGCGTPKALFQALTGRVAQLETLKFGFWNDYGVASTLWNSSNDMDVLERFIDSIDALRNVKMHSLDDEAMQKVRPLLLAKHGRSLRSLEAEYVKSVSWEPEHFYALAETAQEIKVLRLPMKVQKKQGSDKLSVWPDEKATHKTRSFANMRRLFARLTPQKHDISSCAAPSPAVRRSIHSALTSLRHLRQLYLKVYLEYDSYQLISYPDSDAWGSPQIKQKVARDLMLRLWHDFGRKSALELIEVTFVSPGGSTKIWRYTVFRKWQQRASDGIWKSKVEVEMCEDGRDYDPSTFDPFA